MSYWSSTLSNLYDRIISEHRENMNCCALSTMLVVERRVRIFVLLQRSWRTISWKLCAPCYYYRTMLVTDSAFVSSLSYQVMGIWIYILLVFIGG